MFDEIRRIIPKSSWPWFYLAIQQDASIRQMLSNADFSGLAIESLGKDPSAWSPGALALLAIGVECGPGALREAFGDSAESAGLPEEVVEKALDFYEHFRPDPAAPQKPDLTQAGLLALAIYLTCHKNGPSNALAEALKSNTAMGKDSLFYTACACLYTYLPKASDYLAALLNLAQPNGMNRADELAVHILLSQPLAPQDQKEILNTVFDKVGGETSIDMLRCLHTQRGQLASELAETFIASHAQSFDALRSDQRNLTLQEQLALLDRLQAASEVYGMAGRSEEAEGWLAEAESLSQTLQSALAKQRAYSSARKKGDLQPSVAKFAQQDRHDDLIDAHTQALLALSLMDGGHYQTADQVINQVSEPTTGKTASADMYLAQARLACHQDEFEAARQSAMQALSLYAGQHAATMKQGQDARLQNAAQLRQLADLFLHLEFPYGPCPGEAGQAAEMSLALRPAQAEALTILSQAWRKTGNPGGALEAATLAIALAPENIEIKRVYAQALEAAGEWNSALENWKSITGWPSDASQPAGVEGNGVENNEWRSANLSDLRSLAICAIRTGQPGIAMRPLEHVLEYYPTDSEAHAMLGKATIAQAQAREPNNSGDATDNTNGHATTEAGLEHVRQATRLEPHNQIWFQTLSEALAACGRKAEAKETAQAALALAPGEVENLVWFASQCIALDHPLEAVDALEWAIKVYPAEMNLQCLLARVLLHACRPADASQILQQILAAPTVKLADLSAAADIFLQLGEAQSAVQALERACLENQHAPAEARFETFVKLSKAYASLHAHQDALATLDKAAALKMSPIAVQKIKAGIYLDLNKPEKALKSLAAALADDPRDGEAHGLALDILRLSGDMPGALTHAQALTGVENAWPARLEAAEFALQMLDLPLAQALLEGSQTAGLTAQERKRALCLSAETSLAEGISAAKSQALKTRLAGDLSFLSEDLRGRLNAIAARLDFDRSAYERALQITEKGNISAATLVSVGEAALAMRDWEQARTLMRRAMLSAPLEVRPALGLAQSIILTAEDQHLCEAVGASANAPAAHSPLAPLSKEAQKECSDALRLAVDHAVPASLSSIERWGARAKAVFENSSKSWLTSSSTPDEAAALMAALLRNGSPIPSNLSEDYGEDWRVLVYTALKQLESDPALGLQNALLAGERIPQAHPCTPIVHALTAGLASKNQDDELAAQALQKAIQIWQDEPAWLAGAAKLAVARGDVQAAVNYLDLALAGRPEDSDLRLFAAHVLLEQADQPARAAGLLKAIPPSTPIPAEFQALLAEALSRSGNYADALEAYEKVRATSLAEEAAWETRLPIGMAETALRAGDKLQAIQILQEAAETSPMQIELWQNLSDIFRQATLIDSAMEAAQKALALAPADLAAQLWYADQAMACGKSGEAVNILSQAVKQNPHEISLYMRLARAQTCSGQGENALATIKFAKLAPGSGFEDLVAAAHGLLEFDEPEAALVCLERAKNEFPKAAKEQSLTLLSAFAKTYLKAGKAREAIQSVQDALKTQPEDNSALALYHAQALVQLGKAKEAIAVLSEAAAARPADFNLRWELVNLLRCEGDIAQALNVTKDMTEMGGLPDGMRLTAAELALLSLDLPLAESTLACLIESMPQEVGDQEKTLCLKAELAILSDASPAQEINLAKMLASGRPQTVPPTRHTYVTALDARVNLDRIALQMGFEEADGASPLEKVALGQAALALGHWNQAVDLLQQAANEDSSSALAQLALASALTSAAEAAPLYSAAQARASAPRPDLSAPTAYDTVADALRSAATLAPASALLLIQRWQARAQAAFHNSLPDLIPLASTSPEDAAALSAAAIRSNAPLPASPFADHPLVLLHSAAAFAPAAPAQALPAASAAAQTLPSHHPFTPLAHAITAALSAASGNPSAALAAYQSALASSPNEPDWLSAAANLAISTGDFSAAADLFSKSVSLSPDDIDLRLHAAQALLDPANLPQQAADLLQSTPDLPSAPPALHATLAEAFARSGSPDLALAAYRIALDSPLSSSPDWATRLPIGFAHAAILNHQPPAAIATLQSAIATSPNSPDLWMALSAAFAAAELPSDALDAAHHALALNPSELDALLWFASQVSTLNAPDDAIAALSAAMERYPDLLPLADQIKDNLARMTLSTKTPVDERLQAAELALEHLDLAQAESLLTQAGTPQGPAARLYGLCLAAEYSLLTGGQPSRAIIQAYDMCLTHAQALPRNLVGHAYALDGRSSQSASSFEKALRTLDHPNLSEKIALGQAALALGHWNQAVDLLQQAAGEDPSSALAQLALASAITSAAEAAPLNSAAQACASAPRPDLSAPPAYDTISAALKSAAALAPDSTLPLIQRWQARAQAAFHNSLPDLIPLASTSPEDAAALSAAAIRSNAPLPASPFADHPLVLLHSAAALAPASPAQALPAASAAAQGLPTHHPFTPLAHAITAALCSAAGDTSAALAAYQSALASSPNEPNWLSAAANLAISAGDFSAAADLFSKSVSLSPDDTDLRLHAAQALLDPANLPQQAADLLQSTPDLPSAPPALHATLAEALARSGSPDLALAAYRIALDSPLSSSPDWATRLPIGFAHAAILNHQPPAAIATLQSAIATSPNSPDLWMALSSAFAAAELPSDALDAAHHALALNPSDLDALLWFASQVSTLNAPDDAIAALSAAMEKNADHLPLTIALANALIHAGLPDQALAALRRIPDAPNCTFSDLLAAANSLLELKQPDLALAALQRAQSAFPDAPTRQRFDLLLAFAKAYLLSNAPRQGLEALNSASDLSPEQLTQVNLLKADLLAQTGNLSGAATALEESLASHPSHTPSRWALVELSLAAHQPAEALTQAHALTDAADLPLDIRLKSGRFFYQMLDSEAALDVLGMPNDLRRSQADPAEILEHLCWLGAAALDRDRDDLAEQAVQMATKTVSGSIPQRLQTWLSALQARLAYRLNSVADAEKLFEKARAGVEEGKSDGASLQFVCEAAEELGLLDQALVLAEKTINSFMPAEVRPYLIYARLLARQAEMQRLIQPLHVTSHARGKPALSESTREKFEAAVRSSGQRLVAPAALDMNALPPAIQSWWMRGRSAFDEIPSPETLLALAKLPSNPDNTAAYISALGRVGNLALATSTARDYPYDAHVALALAGAHLEKQPRQALEIAEAALEHRSAPLTEEQEAILLALSAAAARSSGDDEAAIQAYEKALAIWDDEAGWHDQVAQLYAQRGQNAQARRHLARAVELNPQALDPALRLAKIALEEQDYAHSAEMFQRITARKDAPLEAWHGLIRSAIGAGALKKAAEIAEKALKNKSDSLETHLLRAEIALQSGEPRNAYQFARNALQINGRSVEAFRIVGQALAALGETEKALKALDRAAELARDPLPFLLERVQIVRKQAGDQAALAALQALLEKYPDHPAILTNFAEILADQGENAPALQAAQIALQNLDGALTTVQSANLHSLAGRLLHRDGQLDQAIHHLSEAVRLNPQSFEACLELGMTYQERRQPSQALQAYRKAIDINPEDARPYYQAGLALKEGRDFYAAEKMLQKAARLSPQDVRIQRLLGSVSAVNLIHGK